jgi:hypothetical protein
MSKKFCNITIDRYKACLMVVTLLSAVFALKNMLDEAYILASRMSILAITATWMIIPYIIMLIGVISTKRRRSLVCLAWSLVIMALFASYAFNGSTENRGEGAQHMHVIFVPFILVLLFFCYSIVWCLHACMARRGWPKQPPAPLGGSNAAEIDIAVRGKEESTQSLRSTAIKYPGTR